MTITRLGWLAPVLALGLGSGCATIVRGTHQNVHFDSVPAGAELRDSRTGEIWRTPVDIELPRDRRYAFVMSMAGYQPQEIYIRSEVPLHWWIIDAFTLCISTLFDAVLGGLYDLRPDRVSVVLERASP
jgi:hypothetical protein